MSLNNRKERAARLRGRNKNEMCFMDVVATLLNCPSLLTKDYKTDAKRDRRSVGSLLIRESRFTEVV